MYAEVKNLYIQGNYDIVEGTVENFKPMQIDKKAAYETFSVNGTNFRYAMLDYNIGYQKVKSLGGVIKKNGQQLKIGYVVIGGERRIVYIEQIE